MFISFSTFCIFRLLCSIESFTSRICLWIFCEFKVSTKSKAEERIQCEEFEEGLTKEFEKFGYQRDGPTDDREIERMRLESKKAEK